MTPKVTHLRNYSQNRSARKSNCMVIRLFAHDATNWCCARRSRELREALFSIKFILIWKWAATWSYDIFIISYALIVGWKINLVLLKFSFTKCRLQKDCLVGQQGLLHFSPIWSPHIFIISSLFLNQGLSKMKAHFSKNESVQRDGNLT